MSWALLVLGLLVWAKAARDLVVDARGGAEVSLGGAMLFGHQWLAGSMLLGYAAVGLAGIPPAAGVALAIVLYLARGAVRHALESRQLGRDLPAAPAARAGLARLAERERELGG
ncbi:MAG: hypothetical protein AB7Q81_08360 [Gammaproteobacteria bacterium]